MAAPDRDAYLMDQFRALAARYEISEYFAGKLKQLEGQSRGDASVHSRTMRCRQAGSSQQRASVFTLVRLGHRIDPR